MGQVFCNRSLLVISMMIFGLWYSHLFSLPACRWGHFTSSRVWWEAARLQASWYYFVRTKLALQLQHCSNHPFIDEPTVITELTLPTAGLFCLGSRLYPTIMQRALNKDVTWFMQTLSQVCQNRASERKAPLAGCKGARNVRWGSKNKASIISGDMLLYGLWQWKHF